jgi:tetratricopeptide (TPR) repeat protein
MSAAITPNEEAQLAQTIEMFEVITQSQPLDYQSLEILKEAYSKLSRNEAVVQTSKRIAEAYVQLGQLSSAILEYESILQRFPEDPDVLKALGEIESRANSFSASDTDLAPAPAAAPATGAGKKEDSGLIKMSPIPANSPLAPAAPAAIDDGRQMMQKLFMDAKLISSSDFDVFWPAPSLKDPPKGVIEPFIQALHDKQILPIDKSMKLLAEKSRLAYLPLEKYDVDVELARTFPRDVCLRWSVLPFDRMSKSVMVATANPFNKQAARDLEAHTKCRLLFYLATPAELTKILKKIFR